MCWMAESIQDGDDVDERIDLELDNETKETGSEAPRGALGRVQETNDNQEKNSIDHEVIPMAREGIQTMRRQEDEVGNG